MNARDRRGTSAASVTLMLTLIVASIAPTITGCSAVRSLAATVSGGNRAGAAGDSSLIAARGGTNWEPDPYLSKLIIAEQQESREQYRRLAEGQITRFRILGVSSRGGRKVILMSASITGTGPQSFNVYFTRSRGAYFVMQTTQGSPLASVANVGAEEQSLGATMLRQQRAHQKIVRDLLANKISSLEIQSVDRVLDRSTLHCVLHYRNGAKKNGIIRMRLVNGYWYVVSIAKA